MRNRLGLKVGVALGGGAARGLAHLGVLRAFEREEIPIDVLVGTSMGAIVGAAYAVDRDIVALETQVREIMGSEEFRKNRLNFLRETKQERGGLLFSVANLLRKGIFYGVSTIRPSFLSAEELADSLEAVVPEARIEDLSMRFGAVTLDIETAEEVVLCSGDLRAAVKASSAIPGILPPVRINGRMLVDGGWVDKIPVLPAFHLGADVVIAVDITAGLQDGGSYNRGVDIMGRANQIKEERLVAYMRRLADVVIEPDIKRVHWADFGAFHRCIEAGDAAARAAIPRIRQLLRHERIWSVLRPGAGRRMAELHLQSPEMCVE
jgi:NTE family protein